MANVNDPKLADLTTDGNFRAKVQSILNDLDGKDEKPKIFETKRTLEQQKEKVKKGYSSTMSSFHLKRGADGGAKAADVADAKKGWGASKRFWLIIGSSALAHEVGWGGLFGLKKTQKQAVVNAIKELRDAGWPASHDAYQVPIGWDPAHVQTAVNWP